MVRALLGAAVMIAASAHADTRVASLNPCFDAWVPQWLPSNHHFIESTQHGNRLERVLALQPDVILYGTYTNRRLVAELQKTAIAVEVTEPTTWQQWQNTLVELGQQLKIENQIAGWAERQIQELEHTMVTDKSIFIVMPNQYSWGGESFVVDLLRQFGAQVIVTEEQRTLSQVGLEQLVKLQPDRVVLDGFTNDYARANEWLWHNALRPWLNQRQLRRIPTTVSGCPAQQAVDYFDKAAGS